IVVFRVTHWVPLSPWHDLAKYPCFEGLGANRVPKFGKSNGKCGLKENVNDKLLFFHFSKTICTASKRAGASGTRFICTFGASTAIDSPYSNAIRPARWLEKSILLTQPERSTKTCPLR
ncbi:MAG: hypothetical protein O3A29_22910, partial [Planctomycetota bacterium]|nr:hypothetical protein [Planctomycetota bacterium]